MQRSSGSSAWQVQIRAGNKMAWSKAEQRVLWQVSRRHRQGRIVQKFDARVADLVRAGSVRVGVFPPQCSRNPTTGELSGWPIDLALALGARLGISVRPI